MTKISSMCIDIAKANLVKHIGPTNMLSVIYIFNKNSFNSVYNCDKELGCTSNGWSINYLAFQISTSSQNLLCSWTRIFENCVIYYNLIIPLLLECVVCLWPSYFQTKYLCLLLAWTFSCYLQQYMIVQIIGLWLKVLIKW